MKIIINDHRKIFGIEQEFNKAFPYLRIEFLAKPSKPGGHPSGRHIRKENSTLGECRTIHKKGTLTVTSDTTVAELEEHLRDVYGLSIEIYRKSGKSWLKTSETMGWTLGKQNNEGELLNNN